MGLDLTLRGEPGETRIVEHSEDLVTWRPLETVTLTTTTKILSDPAIGLQQRFYRAWKP